MGLFKKKSAVDLSDPDYENSKAAIDETAKIFTQMMRSLEFSWSLYGNHELNRWLKHKKLWLPDSEFKIMQKMADDIWLIFSATLLDQENPGNYSQVKMMKVFELTTDYLAIVSVGFPSTKVQREQFAESLTHGMFLVLNSGKEYLAQTFIVRLCAVWVHSRLANIK